jgi:hypothetical protein
VRLAGASHSSGRDLLMLKEIYVRSSAEPEDGSEMFPGTWVETWILLPGTGAWMLLSFRPR